MTETALTESVSAAILARSDACFPGGVNSPVRAFRAVGGHPVVVRQGRGQRLKETPETFSGLVWTGEKSVELGIADSLGNLEFVAREVIKAERVVDYTQKENYFEQLSERLGTRFGESLGRAAAETLGRSAAGLR